MRTMFAEEVAMVSGGELTCTVEISKKDPKVECTGTLSEWAEAGKAVWDFLAASPITVPGIIERLS
ncbi:hypothetical protein [Pseudoxanthomonas sp. J35]|uniref:hypothetical protein n=1 Tax=Pseudoxanthomonas sp. J35 TaxID=935852 RepID=UPI0018DCBC8C|nr:hypothetical protein [Pseudoxanthomonas sp. J35]